MPNYSFQCKECNTRFRIFLTYEEYGKKKVQCPKCESMNTTRRLSRVRFARSEESRLDSLADPSQLEGIEDNPRAMAKLMRNMSTEMGDDIGPEFDEVVDRLEAGQSPEDIERELPDLGSDLGSPGDDL